LNGWEKGEVLPMFQDNFLAELLKIWRNYGGINLRVKIIDRTARSDLNQMVKLTIVKKIGESKNIRYVLHEAFRQFPAMIR
jgi:hypothetical protein